MNDGPGVLRDWSPGDGAWYAAQLTDPDIQRFTTERATTTAADFRAALEALRRNADQAGFAIVDPSSGELAGNIAADRVSPGLAEVSYWVAPGVRRRGLASHALTQLCTWISDHWQIREITLWTHAGNTASQNVARNAGFRYLPVRDEVRMVGNQEWPARWYSLIVDRPGPEQPHDDAHPIH